MRICWSGNFDFLQVLLITVQFQRMRVWTATLCLCNRFLVNSSSKQKIVSYYRGFLIGFLWMKTWIVLCVLSRHGLCYVIACFCFGAAWLINLLFCKTNKFLPGCSQSCKRFYLFFQNLIFSEPIWTNLNSNLCFWKPYLEDEYVTH